MNKLNKILLYFLVKDFLFSLFFGFLFYLLASSADSTYTFPMAFFSFFIFIFTPVYLIKFIKEKNKNLIIREGALIYVKGFITKKESSIPVNSVKMIQLNKGVIIKIFELIKLVIIIEIPLNLSITNKKVDIHNSQSISYITDEDSANDFRKLINKEQNK